MQRGGLANWVNCGRGWSKPKEGHLPMGLPRLVSMAVQDYFNDLSAKKYACFIVVTKKKINRKKIP